MNLRLRFGLVNADNTHLEMKIQIEWGEVLAY